MSKLEELIQQYCPDGVDYKEVKDICSFKEKGSIIKKDLIENGYPVINSSREILGFYSDYNNEEDTLVITSHGAYAGFCHYLEERFYAGSLCYPIQTRDSNYVLTKYLYYFFSNIENVIREKYVNKSGVPYVNFKQFLSIEVPVPPLSIQREIIDTLDELSILTTEISVELAAELAARQQQYEYYRDKLIFNSEGQLVKLREVCSYSKDRISADKLNENNYVGVDNLLQNKKGKTLSKVVPQSGNHTKYEIGDILIGNIRPYLRKIWLANNIGGTNGDILDIRINNKEQLLPKFLYYVLSSEDFFNYDNNHSKGAKMPRGDKEAVMNYEFIIPDIKTQERVVSILDKFDILSNDISEGIPAEIEARQRQYEYYRDKILKFDRKEII